MRTKFNPCELKAVDDQGPAKLWELLRRNPEFQNLAEELRGHDDIARNSTNKNCRTEHRLIAGELIEDWENTNLLSATSLRWLVPDPVFHATRVMQGQTERGCGLSVSKNDRSWRWQPDDGEPRPSITWNTRGPVIFQDGSSKTVPNPWSGWNKNKGLKSPRFAWFDCHTPWPDTPESFRAKVRELWYANFDSPTPSPNRNHINQPLVHEVVGMTDHETLKPLMSPVEQRSRKLAKLYLQLDHLKNYRLIAIPKTIASKSKAIETVNWIRKLLTSHLRTKRELLGNKTDWKTYLLYEDDDLSSVTITTNNLRRFNYVDSLIRSIHPDFDKSYLFEPPQHTSQGKEYSNKLKSGVRRK